jgi:hypothetical protein
MVFQSFEIYAKRKKNKERKGCYEKVQVEADTQITNMKCFILGRYSNHKREVLHTWLGS